MRCQVEYNYNAVSVPEETVGELAEPLLPRRVPDFYFAQLFAFLALVLDCLEVDACRCYLVGIELLVNVSLHYRRLAHAAVADHHQIKVDRLVRWLGSLFGIGAACRASTA